VTLNELKPGERATITGFAAGLAPARLLEMGLLPGTTIKVLRLAPLGDPMDLRVRGYRLSIRKAEAALITIERPAP